MKTERPQLIVGRVAFQSDRPIIQSLHREATLLHQQRVAALIECARQYAANPSDAQNVTELLRVASAFAENT